MGMALGTKKPASDINVTPLIDVVLVLLIIFMVLTPLAEKQKYLRVPEYIQDPQIIQPQDVDFCGVIGICFLQLITCDHGSAHPPVDVVRTR